MCVYVGFYFVWYFENHLTKAFYYAASSFICVVNKSWSFCQETFQTEFYGQNKI